MQELWAEFLTVVVVHLLAVLSPGPDFAVVMQTSLKHTRKIAVWTSLGIGAGVFVHITYTLLGLGIIISQSVVAFNVLKVIGALYLIYIGFKALKPAASSDAEPVTPSDMPKTMSIKKAFSLGFLTNALNPKATLFFLAVFSVMISPSTPLMVQVGYGVWMAVMTALWFVILSAFLTHNRVRQMFARCGTWIEKTMGGVLIALGVKLALASR